ncbi:MAG: hypothetical protein ACYC6P_05680 [Ignavibacteriaceae bacterium]
MDNELLSLIVGAIVLIIVIIVFIRIALHVRKYGGSLTTTMFAATYEFLDKDRRGAVKEIVELNANKKMEEESSDQPYNDFFSTNQIERKYYILWYRLNNKDSYLIWESNSNDRILTNGKGKTLHFSSKQELNEYAFQYKIRIEPEDSILYNLDEVVEWIKRGDRENIKYCEFNLAWNLYDAISQSINVDFDSDDEITNSLYDKLLWSCNHSSDPQNNKNFNPEWNQSEVKNLKNILSRGVQIFTESLNVT